jgi:hypothetical protein
MVALMTDCVDELAKQCWNHRIDGTLIDGHLHFDHRKFAELIVRECVKVMYDNAIERRVPPDINQTPTHYAIAVLEHFGVES